MEGILLTEGGQKVGFGHLSRCVALAQALQNFQIDTCIIVEGDESVISFFPKEVSFLIADWQNKYNLWKGKEIIVIDSYLAPLEIYEKISEEAEVPAFFDDFNRLKYPKGIVINNQEIHPPNHEERKYLSGNQFLPLRKAFWACPSHEMNDEIKEVLISMGGGHPNLKFLKTLFTTVRQALPNCNVHLITGKSVELPNHEDFNNIIIHAGLKEDDIVHLFSQMDLAISSGGVMLNELVTCGLPTIAFLLANNQLNNIQNLLIQELIGYAGDIHEQAFSKYLHNEINRFKNPDLRGHLSLLCQERMDGKGALRIAKVIKTEYYKKTLTVRKAEATDMLAVYNLSNELEVRKVSFEDKEIVIQEHEKWFREKIDNHNVLFLVSELKGNFVGQIRFEVVNDNAIVGISVGQSYRGAGISMIMMEKAISKFSIYFPKVKNIFAYIKKENERSVQYFERCGFRFVKELTIKNHPSVEYVYQT